MNLREFTGMSDLGGNAAGFYRTAVEKLGGIETLRKYIPFDMETLKKSYRVDKNFNTDITPNQKWNAATGLYARQDQVVRLPVPTGDGLFPLLRAHGINTISISQIICILKTAAEMLVIQETGKDDK